MAGDSRETLIRKPGASVDCVGLLVVATLTALKEGVELYKDISEEQSEIKAHNKNITDLTLRLKLDLASLFQTRNECIKHIQFLHLR